MNVQQINILIVEDEQSLANTLALNFKLENYNVLIANTGIEALNIFKTNANNLNLVLLDVMLPGISGYDLFTEFKKTNAAVPIIFLTAKNQSSDKITGLKLGADDYIVKPFDLEELMLRVKNILKRNISDSESPTLFSFGNCSINFETYEIKDVNGLTSTLSKREIG